MTASLLSGWLVGKDKDCETGGFAITNWAALGLGESPIGLYCLDDEVNDYSFILQYPPNVGEPMRSMRF